MLVQIDPQTGAQLGKRLTSLSLGMFHHVWHASYSPDGKPVLAGRSEGSFQAFDADTAKAAWDPIRHGGADVWACNWHPDGRQFVTAGGRWAQVWDAATRQPVGPRLNHDD